MRNSPRFPSGYEAKRIFVDDVDGDGMADLVYVADGKVTLWMNQSGTGWSDAIQIDGTPTVSDTDAVRLLACSAPASVASSGVLTPPPYRGRRCSFWTSPAEQKPTCSAPSTLTWVR